MFLRDQSGKTTKGSQLKACRGVTSGHYENLSDIGVQPRLEIRELQQNEDQWNLYLLGLARFQAVNESKELSYYRIAGIHGRPYVPWDGVEPYPGIDSPGACQHVSPLFLTWHRPYLALVEQTLFGHITDAVNSFPAGAQRQRYAEAALSWRLPYWDWAAMPPSGESVYPSIMGQQTVNVTMPNGTATIPNPLFAYNFHPVIASDFVYNPFASWNQSMRYPTSWADNAVSQNPLVGQLLENSRMSFQNRLYNLFTHYNNFTEFGNEAWIHPGISNADSLESIHDVIHSLTGSNGHMTYLDYSAFDPIFWLHHAMVDRCFALWQVLYPDSYVEPMAAVEQTFYNPVGEVLDINSALKPFYSNGNGSFWTSAGIRSTTTFGYTYTDLGNGSVSAVQAAVNRLYGSNIGTSTPTDPMWMSKKRSNKVYEFRNTKALDASAPNETRDGIYYEYIANIKSQKFALNGSYAVYVFIGEFDDDPSAWALSPNLVGTHAILAALANVDATSNPQGRRSPRGGPPIQVGGTLPLTSKLRADLEQGKLSSMDIKEVTEYLKDNLSWRVGMFDGTQVPVEDVADFMITVVSAQVEPPSSNNAFPKWGAFSELASITEGKPGGR
ncbi:hypothetical protein M433DRAFT_166430 [Acidomyces richmondensis BFW]|nr:MAG: hypothetical protein FE78DRAFT_108262 [Acidomyces sp. 'richmondensis']KYG45101.1 hypothetical protein M433DRAFT_166430 [Acidomyces richmondensis BFW]